MWYFTWALGLLFACSFGIINVMWLELNGLDDDEKEDHEDTLLKNNENS